MSEHFVENQGVRLWTVDQGTGFPLLLCNGGPGLADYLQPIADMLTDVVRVIRFEPCGCGRSDVTGFYTLKTWFEEVEAIRRFYQIERWVVGGHSAGADYALLYALVYPQSTAGVVCLSGGMVSDDRQWHAQYKRLQATEEIPVTAYPVNQDVNQQMNRDWKQYIHRPTLLRELARTQIPALFLYGEDDIRPSWAVEQVAALMPHARFVLVPDAPHLLWSRQPEAVQTLLRTFLREHLAGYEDQL